MEKILNQILTELKDVKSDVRGLKSDVEEIKSDVQELKSDVQELNALKPKIEESHQWLSTLVEAKEVHKAEIHQMGNKINVIEGVLTGFDNCLKPIEKLKKAE